MPAKKVALDVSLMENTVISDGVVQTMSQSTDKDSEALRINEFLEEVYHLAAGDLQSATDTIFETIDRLLLDGAFTVCNEILRCVDVRRLPTALMRSFLTITAAAKDKLPARSAFY